MTKSVVEPTLYNDKPLRSRVKMLGRILGTVIKTYEGNGVYDKVETLRQGFISLSKTPNPKLKASLLKTIEQMDMDTTEQVIRAFSHYFGLTNIAEESMTEQWRKQHLNSNVSLWRGSFDHTIREFVAEKTSAKKLDNLLSQLQYTPVFTAHPTEARRRTTMEHLRRVFLSIENLRQPNLGELEKNTLMQRLESEVRLLWQANAVRSYKPEVIDEIKNGMYYFSQSLFEAVPRTYRILERAISVNYGKKANDVKVPSFMRFGTWIGGDRDGNPFVKPETTVMAVRLQKQEILKEYIKRTDALRGIFTHSSHFFTPPPFLAESIARDKPWAKLAMGSKINRFVAEPYRYKLRTMLFRLEQTLETVEQSLEKNKSVKSLKGSYVSSDEFLNDLCIIRDALVANNEAILTNYKLNDLIRLVETFGFYLQKLDIRQESTVHSDAVNEIIEAYKPGTNYEKLSEGRRLTTLAKLLKDKNFTTPRKKYSAMTKETLGVFKVMHDMRIEAGVETFGSYVISMTHSASHIMEVLLLAKLAGLANLVGKNSFCDIKVSPLFETVQDLKHVDSVLNKLFGNKTYLKALQLSGNMQEIMLGYSDSCKDGGIMASGWNLYQAQQKIIKITNTHNVKCCMFHGRGGTAGRGGGPTHDSILSQPTNTVHGSIKFTEQGEVLTYRYSNPETATYELTMGITGLMKASRSLIKKPANDSADYLKAMATLAEYGESTYRGLIDETEGLLDYYYETTPVQELGMLNIGSRPSHRKKGNRSKSSIRAIPWVFGWAQARYTLPAWFGLGTAMEKFAKENAGNKKLLKEMYEKWPFFNNLLSNAQMALTKANMTTAEDYMALASDQDSAKVIFDQIKSEHRLTEKVILEAGQLKDLLDENEVLKLSLQRREPYLAPLNYIQIGLLKKYRDESLPKKERERALGPLLRSISAIAAGMRNTG